ncbi:MAG: ABC transporter ATP-binding protein [Ignavibacteria bacterium]|nr:ABC transporter ATP-binding protein [Ignavibacteria bacterium]MBT8383612.1 ABC transporter ATP-binding protein [Ignavibacteria bacterium]NNJ52035.1 ABC transporter ATP-binding protein [Ignavibacteriaceae bacterium]NNL22285.1 ABC transporter ATP-binding protein [Ignavibacteriaceae bacterium]
MLELKAVSKKYIEGKSEHIVLNNLNLSVRKGEIVILFGKSGSGKSTLLNIISGIDTPDSGKVFISGTDITKLDEKERTLIRRNKIGFIFQFFNLIPTLTVKENLLLPLELSEIKNEDEKIISILTELELLERSNTYPDKLSGGEQQRIAIARALIHDPDIILADEPTGNLDYETSLQIIDLLDRVVKKKGKTMIMVTHSRDVIGLADRIFSLREGRLNDMKKESFFE